MHPTGGRRSDCTFRGTVVARRDVPGFSVELLQFSAGQIVSRHSHPFAFFYVLLSGDCVEDWDRGRADCGPGAMIFHPREETHAEKFGQGAGARVLGVAVPAATASRLTLYDVPLQEPREARSAMVTYLGHRLTKSLALADTASALTIEGLVYELLGEVCCRRPADARRVPPLEQAKTLLWDRFKEAISLSTIAREVNLHPVHLARAFRRRYSMSVGEYIRQLRIEYACARLASSSVPLSQIACEAGFADHSHFCHVFKRHVGATPHQFRAEHRR